MAKLWEVLKAFDEGKAEEAFRPLSNGKMTLKRDNYGMTFYDSNDKECAYQGVDLEDLKKDWEIVEKMNRKKFKYVFGVFILGGQKRPVRETYDAGQECSLEELMFIISKRYPMDNVKVLSAVGVTNEGETIILVQEGEPVK